MFAVELTQARRIYEGLAHPRKPPPSCDTKPFVRCRRLFVGQALHSQDAARSRWNTPPKSAIAHGVSRILPPSNRVCRYI